MISNLYFLDRVKFSHASRAALLYVKVNAFCLGLYSMKCRRALHERNCFSKIFPCVWVIIPRSVETTRTQRVGTDWNRYVAFFNNRS